MRPVGSLVLLLGWPSLTQVVTSLPSVGIASSRTGAPGEVCYGTAFVQCTMAEPPGQPSPTSMHKRLGNTLPSLAGQERYGVPHTGLRSLATDLFWRSRYYAHCRLIDWACVQISHSFLKHGRSFTFALSAKHRHSGLPR